MNSLPRLQIRSLLLLLLVAAGTAGAQSATQIEVFKSPYCGCCEKWVEHMKRNGFTVSAHNVNDVPAVRKNLGMPDRLGSCHTAKVGGYVIEGHVPAADVQRLLKEKPKAIGLAAPGMPQGSPGMETTAPVPYETLLVQTGGSTHVFARH
jgi:hypothetical protein